MKWLFFVLVVSIFPTLALHADSEPKQVQIESRIVETSNDFLRQDALDHQTTNVQPRSTNPEILFGSGVPKELLDGAPQPTSINPNGTAQSGIELQMTPTITDDGQIRLDVTPIPTQNPLNVPPAVGGPQVGLRSASSSVLINSGETVVLGGLVAEGNGKKTEKIPLLSDIPVMGTLFKNKSNTDQKKDLVVIITPHIIGSDTGD